MFINSHLSDFVGPVNQAGALSDFVGTLKQAEAIESFPAGARVEIVGVQGDHKFCQRLESMGLLPGKRVHILKRQGQGLLLKCDHSRLALRLSSAFAIQAVST